MPRRKPEKSDLRGAFLTKTREAPRRCGFSGPFKHSPYGIFLDVNAAKNEMVSHPKLAQDKDEKFLSSELHELPDDGLYDDDSMERSHLAI